MVTSTQRRLVAVFGRSRLLIGIVAVLLAVLFGVVGYRSLHSSSAATSAISAEPETGTVTGGTTIVADTQASGGRSIKFAPGTTLQSITIAAAGDIGVDPGTGDSQVAAKISADPAITGVLALGDLAYPNVTQAELSYYHQSWGAFKAKTYPAVGNHEYYVSVQPYKDYWNSVGVWSGTPKPPAAVKTTPTYYSFNLGSWHFIALDSAGTDHTSSSAQVTWLKNDLAMNTTACTLAFMHHPYLSGSGANANADTAAIVDALYAAKADIILAGHEHSYVAFNRVNADNQPDPNGIRPWVVGAGGTGASLTNASPPNPNQRAFLGVNGFLKLKLSATTYTWNYIDTAGASRDSGSDSCTL